MLTINDKFKCDKCGHFIAKDDIVTGEAQHTCVTPESELTTETYETLCGDCASGKK